MVKRIEEARVYEADRLAALGESFVREMTRLAIKYDAINLSQGFPDFDPPREIIEAAKRAMDSGLNQYSITWGLPELRQAIAEKMRRDYNLDYDPDWHITVTCGVTEALLATMMGLVNRGDEVILIEPFHEGFAPAVVFAGGKPIFVALEPSSYQLDIDKLRRAITKQTKTILINSPHNPSGRVFSRAELRGIADICQKFDLIAITDEIYEYILYDDYQHIPLASFPGMKDRTVVIGGFGKTYAMTGWRLGYVCSSSPLSNALRAVHDFTTVCAPVPLQAGAVAALNLPQTYFQQLRRDYSLRRDKIMGILEENRLSARIPEGSYYVLADFSGWEFDGNDFDFARWLPEHCGVAVVPGSCFYATPGMGTKSVRFAFAKKLETLEAAGERMRRGLRL